MNLAMPIAVSTESQQATSWPARLLVVEHPQDLSALAADERCMTVADYLAADPQTLGAICVVNLCRSYKYLSIGYYCSLLAEARGHQVYPSVKTINDLARKAAYRLDTDGLELALNAMLDGRDDAALPVEFTLDIFCGSTDYTPLAALARRIFDTFPAPLLRVEFVHSDGWHIRAVKMPPLLALDRRQCRRFGAALPTLRPAVPSDAGGARQWRYHIAILHNPHEPLPPSNRAALARFIEAGRAAGDQVSLIEKRDYGELEKYDALFIRETTAIHHHTYLFAKRAESYGLAVIDDAASILRCTNKIYLAHLLRKHGVPTPRTYVLHGGQLDDIAWLEREIGYPMVMKVPDGAFSRGVFKVADRAEFELTARELLGQSSLLLVQEYLYTEFDWRIGVLNGEVIYASQYFMSKGHWQVAKRDASGKAEFGMGRSVALGAAPPEVLRRALQAANLIGTSLYGVDLKMTASGPVVIEVNDNPNIDVGIEDSVAGEALYRAVMADLVRRIELARRSAGPAPA